ncbi:MAG: hypothetical protein U1E06_13140 [Tabrizicola sp.]|uniref:hypothetical protein n=1 Tax=Tabrizicola sp. TaxID=2005166 RepID=UPI00273305DB|nr:hypothetical protein [Tabrizicola sp.]MDP3261437.1 hypothetical protein [Tabrizicola sp.]MDP3649226.1 hypothetical protein [Paracoccaceae bacterium]MDZ4067770.1 hypothetical protein [Tabrizicola sp.]
MLPSDRLPALRQAARDAMALPVTSAARRAAADRRCQAVSASAAGLLAHRISLPGQNDSISPHLFGRSHPRTNTLILLKNLMKNAAFPEVEAARQIAKGTSDEMRTERPETSLVVKAASDVARSVGPFQGLPGSLCNQGLGPGLRGFDADAYALAVQVLRVALVTGEGVEQARGCGQPRGQANRP